MLGLLPRAIPRRSARFVLLLLMAANCGEGEANFDALPGPDWNEPLVPTPAPAHPMPRLRVSGADLLTAEARPIRLRGVNVCSLEFDASGFIWGLGDEGSALLATLADPTRWNVNAVRMPVNQQWFLEDEEYVARLEKLLDDANERGIHVLLDVQWERGERTDPYRLNILQIPTFGFGNTTEAFWHKALSRWSNRTNLLCDLINEPHDQPPATTAAAMQALVDRIRRRDSETLLVIGGMGWAHSIDYYREHPLDGANLVYSAHQYLPYDPPERFPANFADAARTLPVLIGEFSAEEQYVDGLLYQERLVEEAEAAGVDGWMPWAIGCGFSADDDSREPLATLAAKIRALNP